MITFVKDASSVLKPGGGAILGWTLQSDWVGGLQMTIKHVTDKALRSK